MKKSILYSGIVLAMFSTMSMAVDSSSVPSSQEELSAHQKQMADRLSDARQSASADSAPCKNEQGKPIECPKPELGHFDVCPNLDGDQNRLPPGRIMKDGDCILVNLENDVCSNIAGVQAYTPLGMVNNAGICETPIAPPPVDVCPNIPGDQAIVPDGMEIKNGDCVSSAPLAVDLCTNLDGDQAVIPKGYTQNADGTCTMIESCVPWFDLAKQVYAHGSGLYKSSRGDIYIMHYGADFFSPMPIEAPFGINGIGAILGQVNASDIINPIAVNYSSDGKTRYFTTIKMDSYIKNIALYDKLSSHPSFSVNELGVDNTPFFGHIVHWVKDPYVKTSQGNPEYIYHLGQAGQSEFVDAGSNTGVSKGFNFFDGLLYYKNYVSFNGGKYTKFEANEDIVSHDWRKVIMLDCDVTVSNGQTTHSSDVFSKIILANSLNVARKDFVNTPTDSLRTYTLDIFARSKSMKTLN